MFKIGEFSRLSQVSIRMLRYYDETGIFKPAHIDQFTGYRLYSASQMAQLTQVVFLRDSGFNVSEIKEALADWQGEKISALLRAKQKELTQQIADAQNRQRKIAAALADIQEERLDTHCNIVIKSIPAYQVLSLRRIISDYFCEAQLWQELSSYVATKQLGNCTNDCLAIYHDADYKETDVDVEVAMIVTSLGNDRGEFCYRKVEAVETMACVMIRGPYENIAKAYLQFAAWLELHGQYRIQGLTRQLCHQGPWNETDPQQYLTEIQIPIQRI